jgi:hypothetical protein
LKNMAKATKPTDFASILSALKSATFEVTPAAATYPSGSLLVSKYGAAAVLAGNGTAIVEGPGASVHGKIAHLLDRGYQKFLSTSEYEIPATSTQLGAIHRFTEELKQVTGESIFFNQALGTTSDIYRYDRLKGHGTPDPQGVRPWQATAGH